MNAVQTAAFPFKYTDRDGTIQVYTGLSVREHFAAMAMMGMCAHPCNEYSSVAKYAVAMADTLIAELAKAKP